MPPRKRASSSSASLTPPPALKRTKSRAPAFPPPLLDPALHPPRAGSRFPAHEFADPLPRNGALPASFDAGAQGQGEAAAGVDAVPARRMLVGAHMSIAGGPACALLRAGLVGAGAVAMFMKGHRTWKSKALDEDNVKRFRELLRPREEGGMGYGPESILVHGNYLINLGNPDKAKWKQAYECFEDDVGRCHQLGIKLYNWHPGSTVGACTKEESFALVAQAINDVHAAVPEVITVIENMANAGSNILGTAFADLAAMIALVADKSRVRVCLDTAHLFAAGYDLRTADAWDATMRMFEDQVGLAYLGGMHLNDSKAELGANRDLHENIGLGHIGLSGFRAIVRDPRVLGLPLILETPNGDAGDEHLAASIWTKEVALLHEIQGINDDAWADKQPEIAARWRAERDRLDPPKPEKVKKEPKGKKEKKDKGGKAKAKGKKAKKEESEGEEEEEEVEE
ncbi:DNA-(apurinic or apyrimidinic site) lyase [Cryptotrichosporon argae]